MYKYELYKILSKKSIYVVLVFIIGLMVFANHVSSDMIMNNATYDELAETLGGPITPEKVDYAREKMRESDEEAQKNPTPPHEEFENTDRSEEYVHFLLAVAGMQAEELAAEKEALQHEMSTRSSDTYAYKETSKKLNRLEKLDQPYGYYVIQAWRGMNTFIDNTLGPLFIIVLILIGVTPVFSDEHAQRTAALISATKHGKRKIVTAKLLASMTYVFGIFILLNSANAVINWYIHGGFAGWDAPMQSFINHMMGQSVYQYSPFNWNIWQTYAITLVIQLFASLAISILVLFISSIIKNTMIGFFVAGAILMVPALIRTLRLERFTLLKQIKDFSYLELLKVEGLIHEFKAYNLFGQPVLYPILILVVFLLVSIGIVALTYSGLGKQEINE